MLLFEAREMENRAKNLNDKGNALIRNCCIGCVLVTVLVFSIVALSLSAEKSDLKCWDLNENGDCDLITEDINGDGICGVGDCRGQQGDSGICTEHCLNGRNGEVEIKVVTNDEETFVDVVSGNNNSISINVTEIDSVTINWSAASSNNPTNLSSTFTIGCGGGIGSAINGAGSYFTRLSHGGTLKDLRGFIQISNPEIDGGFIFDLFVASGATDFPIGTWSPSPFTPSLSFIVNTTATPVIFYSGSDLINTKKVVSGDYIALSINVLKTVTGAHFSIGASIKLLVDQ